MSNKILKTTLFLGAIAFSTNAMASDLNTAHDKSTIVMTQLNIAKKNAMGELIGANKSENIELNGAKVKSPAYANKSKLQSKIWFTTQEGKQLKWPFIDFYNSSPVSLIEPAAGIQAEPKLYNHLGGKDHKKFHSALPSTFRDKGLTPFYAAIELEPSKRPTPRKLSFMK